MNVHKEYNEEPVVYCTQCLSLKIRNVDDMSYCDQCGCTELEEANIFEWEKLYEQKYNEKYLEIKRNGEWRKKTFL